MRQHGAAGGGLDGVGGEEVDVLPVAAGVGGVGGAGGGGEEGTDGHCAEAGSEGVLHLEERSCERRSKVMSGELCGWARHATRAAWRGLSAVSYMHSYSCATGKDLVYQLADNGLGRSRTYARGRG